MARISVISVSTFVVPTTESAAAVHDATEEEGEVGGDGGGEVGVVWIRFLELVVGLVDVFAEG